MKDVGRDDRIADRLLAIVGGDTAARDAILDLFQEDAPPLLQSIESAVADGKAAMVRDGAHKLRGMLLAVCADSAAALAGELEGAARAGHTDRFAILASALSIELSAVRAAIPTRTPR